MALGYEVYESDNDFEVDGITGEVSKYSSCKLEYPCFIITLSKSSMFHLNAARGLISTQESYDEEIAKSLINIYFDVNDTLAYFGKILPAQVKSLLKIFESEKIVAKLDEETELTGMYLYTLAE